MDNAQWDDEEPCRACGGKALCSSCGGRGSIDDLTDCEPCDGKGDCPWCLE